MGKDPIRINISNLAEEITELSSGDKILLNGIIYTARDAAHEKIISALDNNETPPFPIKNSVIYYVGPSPARPDQVIGSAGPTTSYRMDSFTPQLMDQGLKATIGKGPRSPKVIEAIQRNRGAYFAAIGGAAALISDSIKSSETIAYPELGPEAVRKLEVDDFPAIVAIDSKGNDLYTSH